MRQSFLGGVGGGGDRHSQVLRLIDSWKTTQRRTERLVRCLQHEEELLIKVFFCGGFLKVFFVCVRSVGFFSVGFLCLRTE